jgi:hypothetical protein
LACTTRGAAQKSHQLSGWMTLLPAVIAFKVGLRAPFSRPREAFLQRGGRSSRQGDFMGPGCLPLRPLSVNLRVNCTHAATWQRRFAGRWLGPSRFSANCN